MQTDTVAAALIMQHRKNSQKQKIKQLLHTELSGNRALSLLVLLIAFIGLLSAFRFGSAALDYHFVRNAVELWQNDKSAQTSEKYHSAKNAINRAQNRHSSHPLYADMSGQLHEWGVLAGYEFEETLTDAKDDYLRAVELRPAWPVTWASLALIKWRMQEFDDEMLNYLSMADKFGSQKPEVHVLFTQLGLALYQANHPFYVNIREQTQHRLVSGLRNTQSREKVMQAIISYNAVEVACIWSAQRDAFVYKNILACKEKSLN